MKQGRRQSNFQVLHGAHTGQLALGMPSLNAALKESSNERSFQEDRDAKPENLPFVAVPRAAFLTDHDAIAWQVDNAPSRHFRRIENIMLEFGSRNWNGLGLFALQHAQGGFSHGVSDLTHVNYAAANNSFSNLL